jgi:hypothetical protein
LIHRGEFVAQRLVEIFDDLGITSHATHSLLLNKIVELT